MTSTAVTRVSKDGEILTEAGAPFQMAGYLASLDLSEQAKLMAAYDAACTSLLGPNDQQKKGDRVYKKKSGWRKLGRYFGISVTSSLDDVRVDPLPDGEFIAFARARAMAPWGQTFDDVGACSSDEERGDREITMADAVATAMTRAANRAVSNLIAMGEVSAEEVSERVPVRERGPEPQCPKCGGRMWDNRGRKTNPNAPDFKCRNKSCDGLYWPGEWPPQPKTTDTASSSDATSPTGAAPAAANAGSTVVADEDRKLKGKRLGDYTTDELNDIVVAALDEPERFAELLAVASRVLDRRIRVEMGNTGDPVLPEGSPPDPNADWPFGPEDDSSPGSG